MTYKRTVTKAGLTNTYRAFRLKARARGKRADPSAETPEAQKKGNLRRATWMLTWLMNSNFHDGDILLTLNYHRKNRPTDYDRMNKDAQNFLKKLQRRVKKAHKKRLKYIRVMEIGKKGARHHHMVISDTDLSVLRECWELGGIDVQPLYSDGNYRRIAEYFAKWSKMEEKATLREMTKLYYPSRGLKKPKESRGREMSENKALQIFVPDGYYLDEESVRWGVSAYDGTRTLIYMCVRIEKPKGRRRKRKDDG